MILNYPEIVKSFPKGILIIYYMIVLIQDQLNSKIIIN